MGRRSPVFAVTPSGARARTGFAGQSYRPGGESRKHDGAGFSSALVSRIPWLGVILSGRRRAVAAATGQLYSFGV